MRFNIKKYVLAFFILIVTYIVASEQKIPNIRVFDNPKKEVTTIEGLKNRDHAEMNIKVKKREIKDIVGSIENDQIIFYFKETDGVGKDSKFIEEPNIKRKWRKSRFMQTREQQKPKEKRELTYTYNEQSKSGQVEVEPNRFKDGMIYFMRKENGKETEMYRGYIPRFPRPAENIQSTRETQLTAIVLMNDEKQEIQLFENYNTQSNIKIPSNTIYNKKYLEVNVNFKSLDQTMYIDSSNSGTSSIFNSPKYGTRLHAKITTVSPLSKTVLKGKRVDYTGKLYSSDTTIVPALAYFDFSELKDWSSGGYYQKISVETFLHNQSTIPLSEITNNRQRYSGKLKDNQIGAYEMTYQEKYCTGQNCDQAIGKKKIYLQDRNLDPNLKKMNGSSQLGEVPMVNKQVDAGYKSIALELKTEKGTKVKDDSTYRITMFNTNNNNTNTNTGIFFWYNNGLHRESQEFKTKSLTFKLKFHQSGGSYPELYAIITKGNIIGDVTVNVDAQIICRIDNHDLRKLKLTTVMLNSDNKYLGTVKYLVDRRLSNESTDDTWTNSGKWITNSGKIKNSLSDAGKDYSKMIKIESNFNQTFKSRFNIKITSVESIAGKNSLLDANGNGGTKYKKLNGSGGQFEAAIPYNISIQDFIKSGSDTQVVSINNVLQALKDKKAFITYPFTIKGSDNNLYNGDISVGYDMKIHGGHEYLIKEGTAKVNMSNDTKAKWNCGIANENYDYIAMGAFEPRGLDMQFTKKTDIHIGQNTYKEAGLFCPNGNVKNTSFIATKIEVSEDGVQKTENCSGNSCNVKFDSQHTIGYENGYFYIQKGQDPKGTKERKYSFKAYYNDISLGHLDLTVTWYPKNQDIGSVTFSIKDTLTTEDSKSTWFYKDNQHTYSTNSLTTLKSKPLKEDMYIKNELQDKIISKDTILSVDGMVEDTSSTQSDNKYRVFKSTDKNNHEKVAIPIGTSLKSGFNVIQNPATTKSNFGMKEYKFNFFINNTWYTGKIVRQYTVLQKYSPAIFKVTLTNWKVGKSYTFAKKNDSNIKSIVSNEDKNINIEALSGDNLPFLSFKCIVQAECVTSNTPNLNRLDHIKVIKNKVEQIQKGLTYTEKNNIKIEIKKNGDLIITKLRNYKNYENTKDQYTIIYLDKFGKDIGLVDGSTGSSYGNKLDLWLENTHSKTKTDLGKFTVKLDGRLKDKRAFPSGKNWIFGDGHIGDMNSVKANTNNQIKKSSDLISITSTSNNTDIINNVVSLETKTPQKPLEDFKQSIYNNITYEYNKSETRAMPVGKAPKDFKNTLAVKPKDRVETYDFTLLGQNGNFYTGQVETKYDNNTYNAGEGTVDVSQLGADNKQTDWARWDNGYNKGEKATINSDAGVNGIKLTMTSGKLFNWKDNKNQDSNSKNIVNRMIVRNLDNPTEYEEIFGDSNTKKLQTSETKFHDNQFGIEQGKGFFIVNRGHKNSDGFKRDQTKYQIEIYNGDIKLGELKLTVINRHDIGKVTFEVDTRMTAVDNTKWLFKTGKFTKGIDQTVETSTFDKLLKVTGNFNNLPNSNEKITSIGIENNEASISKTSKEGTNYKLRTDISIGNNKKIEAAMPTNISFDQLNEKLVISLKGLTKKDDTYSYKFNLNTDAKKSYTGVIEVKTIGDKALTGDATVELSKVNSGNDNWIGWNSTKINTNREQAATTGDTKIPTTNYDDIKMKFNSGKMFNWRSGFETVPTAGYAQGHVVDTFEVKYGSTSATTSCKITTIIEHKKWACKPQHSSPYNEVGIDDTNFYIAKRGEQSTPMKYEVKLKRGIVLLGTLNLTITNQSEQNIGTQTFKIDKRLVKLDKWLFSEKKLSDNQFDRDTNDYSDLVDVSNFTSLSSSVYIKDVKSIKNNNKDLTKEKTVEKTVNYNVYKEAHGKKVVMPTGKAPDYQSMPMTELNKETAIYLNNLNNSEFDFKIRGTDEKNYTGKIKVELSQNDAANGTATVDLSNQLTADKAGANNWIGWKSDKIGQNSNVTSNNGASGVEMNFSSDKLFNWQTDVNSNSKKSHIVTEMIVKNTTNNKSCTKTGSMTEKIKFDTEFTDNEIGIDSTNFYITKKTDSFNKSKSIDTMKTIENTYDITLKHYEVELGKLNLTITNSKVTDLATNKGTIKIDKRMQGKGWLWPNGQLKQNTTRFTTGTTVTGTTITGTGDYKDMISGTNFQAVSTKSTSIDPTITDIMMINSLNSSSDTPLNSSNNNSTDKKYEVFGNSKNDKIAMIKGDGVKLTNLVEGTPVNLNNTDLSNNNKNIKFIVKGKDNQNNMAYYKGEIQVTYVGKSASQETGSVTIDMSKVTSDDIKTDKNWAGWKLESSLPKLDTFTANKDKTAIQIIKQSNNQNTGTLFNYNSNVTKAKIIDKISVSCDDGTKINVQPSNNTTTATDKTHGIEIKLDDSNLSIKRTDATKKIPNDIKYTITGKYKDIELGTLDLTVKAIKDDFSIISNNINLTNIRRGVKFNRSTDITVKNKGKTKAVAVEIVNKVGGTEKQVDLKWKKDSTDKKGDPISSQCDPSIGNKTCIDNFYIPVEIKGKNELNATSDTKIKIQLGSEQFIIPNNLKSGEYSGEMYLKIDIK